MDGEDIGSGKAPKVPRIQAPVPPEVKDAFDRRLAECKRRMPNLKREVVLRRLAEWWARIDLDSAVQLLSGTDLELKLTPLAERIREQLLTRLDRRAMLSGAMVALARTSKPDQYRAIEDAFRSPDELDKIVHDESFEETLRGLMLELARLRQARGTGTQDSHEDVLRSIL